MSFGKFRWNSTKGATSLVFLTTILTILKNARFPFFHSLKWSKIEMVSLLKRHGDKIEPANVLYTHQRVRICPRDDPKLIFVLLSITKHLLP